MNKKYSKTIGVLAFSALLLCGACTCGMMYDKYQVEKANRAYLLDFVHYCQKNEGLRQINPNKDYSKSSTHELKDIARFYIDQPDFGDVTSYDDILIIDDICGYKYDARMED